MRFLYLRGVTFQRSGYRNFWAHATRSRSRWPHSLATTGPSLTFPLPAEAAACPSCAIPAAQGGWGQESWHPAASQTRSDLMRFVFRTVKSETCIKNTDHPNLIKNLSCRSDHILKTTASSACEIRLVIGISEVMLPWYLITHWDSSPGAVKFLLAAETYRNKMCGTWADSPHRQRRNGVREIREAVELLETHTDMCSATENPWARQKIPKSMLTRKKRVLVQCTVLTSERAVVCTPLPRLAAKPSTVECCTPLQSVQRRALSVQSSSWTMRGRHEKIAN